MIVLGTSDLAALRGKLTVLAKRLSMRGNYPISDSLLVSECLRILDHAQCPDYTAAKKCMEDE